MRVVIFIPCSSRKQIKPKKNMCARDLTGGSIGHVAHSWGIRLSSATQKMHPDRIYCGRSFREGRKAANCLDAELVVISAGYGLVREQDEISPYSLTVASGQVDSISRKIHRSDWSPNAWWKMLGKNTLAVTDLSLLLTKTKPDLILMSLSAGYTKLIEDELRNLTQNQRLRLRIFCPGTNPHVPSILDANILPYDNRIDGKDSPNRGTMSDFSCRALHHFAHSIGSGIIKGVNLEEDKSSLLKLMADWSPPKKLRRNRQTDEEIIAFILNAWHRTGGLSGATFRLLRGSGFACEQGRFRDLFRLAASRRNLENRQNE